MKRVLLVDDEPLALNALRRLLRADQHTWDMRFATSGESALEELANGPADVVVTDMRMPGMDGAQLLEKVRDRYPDVLRIILSGHTEGDAAQRALGICHRYLAKPCDPIALKSAIGGM